VLRSLEKGVVRTKEGVFCADGWGMKATAAGIYGIRLLLTKRCGRLSPRAVLALDSWPKELPFDQNHRERKGVGKGVDKGVEKIVENFVKKWKKMENYSYFCTD
jgi:hypothetical protein